MLKQILTIAATMLIMDTLWLGLISKKFIQKQLGNKLKNPINFKAATLVYILLVTGIYLFVLNNNFATTTPTTILLGALFGFIIYGIYDFTNLSTLKNWPIKLVLVDILWGAIIGATSTLAAILVK